MNFIKIYYVTVSVVTVIFKVPLPFRILSIILYNYLTINNIYHISEEIVKTWVPYFFTVIL